MIPLSGGIFFGLRQRIPRITQSFNPDSSLHDIDIVLLMYSPLSGTRMLYDVVNFTQKLRRSVYPLPKLIYSLHET